jgi:hypothetical protein
MPVKHKFVYSGGGTKVFADPNWNDAHNIDAAWTPISATYTVLDTDEFIEIIRGSSPYTINLPTAVGRTGRCYEFATTDAGTAVVTLDGFGAETISGQTTFLFSNQHQYLRIRSNGTNWIILGQN